MSAHKHVEISPDAREDFTQIQLYTAERWGNAQALRYEAALERAIMNLGAFPEIGVRRDHLAVGYRSQRFEHHVIFYRIMGDVIEIVRILHERVDPILHL
jgi:toxin ParE1/3/4